MSQYNLVHGILRRIPPTPKTLKQILDLQTEMNRRCTWSHERLSLAPVREPQRSLSFPFLRLGAMKPGPAFAFEPQDTSRPPLDACAFGTTKVRDLWSAHLVAAFLRTVSAKYPDLVFELRDESGFVLTGATWIRAGKVERQREWLNKERERALEVTGDPNAAVPFIVAESQALQGKFFEEGSVSEFAEVPEVQELDLGWNDLESLSLADLADMVVARVANATAPAVAQLR
jgi:hypothetical protein